VLQELVDCKLLESLADFDSPQDADAKLLGQVHKLAMKVQALNAELRVKHVENLHAAYDTFVLECRATKDKHDAFALDSFWDETTRRLENEVAAYRSRLNEVIAFNRPVASNFPTQKEIAAYEKKKAAAEAALQKKREELIRTHLINASVESETRRVGACLESSRRDAHT
jgi:hypothetical protein